MTTYKITAFHPKTGVVEFYIFNKRTGHAAEVEAKRRFREAHGRFPKSIAAEVYYGRKSTQ